LEMGRRGWSAGRVAATGRFSDLAAHWTSCGASPVHGMRTFGRSLDWLPRMADFAVQHRLPTMFVAKGNVEAGGLMSYGAERVDLVRRAAVYKILKGAKPADLPVEQASKCQLVINLKTRPRRAADPSRPRRRGDRISRFCCGQFNAQ